MTRDKDLQRMHRATMVNESGELVVNAGRFSRGAVIMAFEMMGGIENFAEWAEDNPGEFYTKLFSKTIGREVENKSSDSVESLLKILDGEATEIPAEGQAPPPITPPEVLDAPSKRSSISPSMRDRLNKAGEAYFTSEATSDPQP